MNYIIIVIVLFILLLTIYNRKKSLKQPNEMDEWRLKIENAQLTKELYQDSNENEREDLFRYYSFKISDTFSVDEMPKPLKIFFLIEILEMEVNNGGLLQFFTNSSGEYAKETIESLDLINAKKISQILQEGINIVIKYNENHKSLNSKLNKFKKYEIIKSNDIDYNEKMSRELNELDSVFFDYPDDIYNLKWEFIQNNINEEFWNEIKEKYGC